MRLHADDIAEIVNQLFDRLMEEKKARKPRKAKGEDYSEAFNAIWSIYPSRPGNSKREAYSAFRQRLAEGVAASYLYQKTKEYAAYCDSHEITGGNLVLLARTFYGPNHRFDCDWPIKKKDPKDEPWAKIPVRNEDLDAWTKEHGYSKPRAGEFYPDWRRRLADEVEQRMREMK